MYYPVDGPTGNYTGKSNVVKSAYRALNNQYPALSHWYIPSMDELGFIAKACKDEGLQQAIENAGGVVIGDEKINNQNWDTTSFGPTGVNSPNSPAANIQYRRSYVWSSCGSWKDGATAQYLQKSSTLTQFHTDSQINNQFTNAWAIKFDPSTTSQNINNYKVSKFHDLDDRLELRLVRMVRCDQRYYDQNSPETLKNSFWQVPRLTISSVVCGAIPTSSLGSGYLPRTRYNSTNWTFDPQTATIFKNTP